jgi:hypothetical protein
MMLRQNGVRSVSAGVGAGALTLLSARGGGVQVTFPCWVVSRAVLGAGQTQVPLILPLIQGEDNSTMVWIGLELMALVAGTEQSGAN